MKTTRALGLIADILWLTCFITIWILLILLWNTFWAILLVPMLTIMLAGMAEVVHQAAHGALFGRFRPLNNLLGTIAALMLFGIDLRAYRRFHFKHHQTVNTRNDTELLFYGLPAYLEKIKSWQKLSFLGKITLIPSTIALLGKTIAKEFYSNSPFIKILGFGIPAAIAIIGLSQGFLYSIPLQIFIAWYLPFGLFLFIDLFITQSEHYNTNGIADKNTVRATDQYQISWNLKLPRIIEFMVMARNLHAEHHQNPGTHWFMARDQKRGRTLPLKNYLKSWWINGPRVIKFD